MGNENKESDDSWNFKDFNQRSAEVSKTLRSWLVAYGIGLPVLVLTRPEVADAIRASQKSGLITFLFLSGVALQVFNAFYIKWLSWFRSELLYDHENSKKKFYLLADKLHKFVWTDLIIDIWTLIAYSWGTYAVISIYL